MNTLYIPSKHLIKALCCLLMLGSFFFQPQMVEATKIKKFFAKNIDNKRFDSRKVGDSPIVVSIFFTNCIPCLKEIPQLYSLISTEFTDVPLLFIDPLREDSKNDIRNFAKRLQVPASYFYKDNLGAISKRFFKNGQYLFPTIIGIKNHQVIFSYSGLNSEILENISKTLKESQ